VVAGLLLQAAKANIPAIAIRNITFFISLNFLKLSFLLIELFRDFSVSKSVAKVIHFPRLQAKKNVKKS
jgi:hypothetical protein